MHDYNYYLRLVEGAVSNINYPSRPAELYKPIAYTMSQGSPPFTASGTITWQS